MMTNEECEKAIAEKLREIKEILEAAYPTGKYLTLCICKDYMWFNNEIDNEEFPINWAEAIKWNN